VRTLDKIAYIAQVRDAAFQHSSQVHSELPGQVPLAVRLLAELYASVTEAEGLQRYVFAQLHPR